jgi:hypothetical protein
MNTNLQTTQNSADIIPLRPLRETESAAARDQRSTQRIISEDRLFMQVVQCPEAPHRVGATLCCDAVNYSAGGLQFQCDIDLPAGTLIDLWIDVRARPGKFFLNAEVIWSRSAAEGAWHAVGVRFLPGPASDLRAWLAFQKDICLQAGA